MVEQQKQESFGRPLNTSLDCRGVAHQQIGKAIVLLFAWELLARQTHQLQNFEAVISWYVCNNES